MLTHHGVDALAIVKRLVEIEAAHRRSHHRLGVLDDGQQRPRRTVRGLERVLEAKVNSAADVDAHIVARRARGALDRDRQLSHVVHVANLVDERNGNKPAGLLNFVKLAEALRDHLDRGRPRGKMSRIVRKFNEPWET